MPTAPADPVIVRIRQNLLDAMNGVKTTAGARQTIEAFYENPTEGHSPRDCLAVLHTADVQDAKAPAGGVGYRQHFSVSVFIFANPSIDTPIETRLAYVVSDVTKALMTDYRRNNDALDTSVGTPVPAEPEHGAIAGGAFRVSVYYRTPIDDPTTSI